jgi:hypothetical protein
MVCAVLLAAGGLVSWLTIPRRALEPEPEPREPVLTGGHQLDCPHRGR